MFMMIMMLMMMMVPIVAEYKRGCVDP